MEYRIGLDIGIGSVGWSVISGSFGKARIENFGTRIFDSGENKDTKSSNCQERRGFRSVRRLERRRWNRKELLKKYFDFIGLTNITFNDDYEKIKDEDVYKLKLSGIERRLSVAELYKCFVHSCNHRGYKEFYDIDEDDEIDEDSKEEGRNLTAVSNFDKAFSDSNCRIVSEYLITKYTNGNFVDYRNHTPEKSFIIIRRSLMEDEVNQILQFQKQFYPQLTDDNIKKTISIIFAQRDFETGPGNENDNTRIYKGFIALQGMCPFYHNEHRGFRCTVIADLYSVANTLSQYRYIDKNTGEFNLPSYVSTNIIESVLDSGQFSISKVKSILKEHNIELVKTGGLKNNDKRVEKAICFITPIKKCIEDAGEKWEDWIAQDQLDYTNPSKLHKIGEVLSKFQTPNRRKEELKKLGFVSEILSKTLCKKKLTGSASTSDRYMCEAIMAFMDGEIYGNFQANFVKRAEQEQKPNIIKYDKLPPSAIDDSEVKTNRVVFKAINESRKIINAIIDIYGTPDDIVVEVADELGRSFEERKEIEDRQRDNEKLNDTIKNEIRKIIGDDSQDPSEIRPDMIERYKLYAQQEGKSLYSGEPLGDIRDVLNNPLKKYEIDHIVPYSLILDNTLNNKALVLASENQAKGQRTPLQYLSSLQGDKKDRYIAFVKHMYARDNAKKNGKKADANRFPVNEKKLAYLELPNIYSEESRELMQEWKSRNINDTRYITKYIVGMISKNLKFKDEDKKHVFGVKGAVTSRMRRTWLVQSKWGEEEKNRETYLNHAVDATVIACLSPAYIEIASDAVKLRSIYRKYRNSFTSKEYVNYLNSCKDKMETYYGFKKDYTEKLLRNPDYIPCFVEKLREEIDIRFNDSDRDKFDKDVMSFYGNTDNFKVKPHMAITSRKQNLKFKGCISDANPIRIKEIDGVTTKISRKNIVDITADLIDSILTDDVSLINTLKRIFDGKDSKYTVADYLSENNSTVFKTDKGQIVRKVSIIAGTISNYAKKQISDDNYSVLGGLKYYCFELYKNQKGDTCMRGVRFIDIVKRNGKLYIKENTMPTDYVTHIMYLFKNDYVEITNKKGELKFAGYSGAAKNINENRVYQAGPNSDYGVNPLTFEKDNKTLTYGKSDTVHKYSISILGIKGGEIRCSEPLSLIKENT